MDILQDKDCDACLQIKKQKTQEILAEVEAQRQEILAGLNASFDKDFKERMRIWKEVSEKNIDFDVVVEKSSTGKNVYKYVDLKHRKVNESTQNIGLCKVDDKNWNQEEDSTSLSEQKEEIKEDRKIRKFLSNNSPTK